MIFVLFFVLLSASHVQHAVNGFPANTLALPQFNETDIVAGYNSDVLAPNISEFSYVKTLTVTLRRLTHSTSHTNQPIETVDITGKSQKRQCRST